MKFDFSFAELMRIADIGAFLGLGLYIGGRCGYEIIEFLNAVIEKLVDKLPPRHY